MAPVFNIELTAKAEKELKKLPRQIAFKITDKISRLAIEPRPQGHKKLTNFHVPNAPDELYRIRIGDYRVVYSIEDDRLVIVVVKVAHRKEVYE
jgi:mRNA interferase RelE/StbE